METLHEIKLDFATLSKMIMSEDTENGNLALSLLETVDFKKNMVLILTLYKKTNQTPDYWKKQAPKLWAKMKKAGVPEETPLTYKDMLKIMQEKKISHDQVNIFVQSVNDTLMQDLALYGYDFIDKIEITLKPKTV